MSLQRMFSRKSQPPQPPKAQPVPEAIAEIVAYARVFAQCDAEALQIVFDAKPPEEVAQARAALELAHARLADDLATVNAARERLAKLSEPKKPVFA